MAEIRPSIMSLGATISAPASASESAVLASNATLESFSTSNFVPSPTGTPQCPWEVYSQRQTSAMMTRDFAAGDALDGAQTSLHYPI